jgi:hypothetical protein
LSGFGKLTPVLLTTKQPPESAVELFSLLCWIILWICKTAALFPNTYTRDLSFSVTEIPHRSFQKSLENVDRK